MLPTSCNRGVRFVRAPSFQRDLRSPPQRKAQEAARTSLSAVRYLTANLDSGNSYEITTSPQQARYNLLSPIRSSQSQPRQRVPIKIPPPLEGTPSGTSRSRSVPARPVSNEIIVKNIQNDDNNHNNEVVTKDPLYFDATRLAACLVTWTLDPKQ